MNIQGTTSFGPVTNCLKTLKQTKKLQVTILRKEKTKLWVGTGKLFLHFFFNLAKVIFVTGF